MIVRTILILLFCVSTLKAQELTPKQIIQKIDETERVSSSEGTAKQIITTSGGEKRTLETKTFTKNRNEKQLLIYTAPNRVKGDKILMLNDGDDIWFYTPKTDRVRHLASHAKRQKVQGSDFAYEDIAGGKIEEDYTYTLLGEEEVEDSDCYKFELIPTESGPHYSKLILWAEKERFVTRRIDYYEDDELSKRLNSYKIEKIDNRWYPMKYIMTNIAEGGETIIATEKIQFDVELNDNMFTTNYLKRR